MYGQDFKGEDFKDKTIYGQDHKAEDFKDKILG